jgi:hypothetical protein
MTKGVVGVHGLGSQTNVGRNVTLFTSDVSSLWLCATMDIVVAFHRVLHT